MAQLKLFTLRRVPTIHKKSLCLPESIVS